MLRTTRPKQAPSDSRTGWPGTSNVVEIGRAWAAAPAVVMGEIYDTTARRSPLDERAILATPGGGRHDE
jgi:hypothetical protein